MTGKELRNVYSRLYNQAVFEGFHRNAREREMLLSGPEAAVQVCSSFRSAGPEILIPATKGWPQHCVQAFLWRCQVSSSGATTWEGFMVT